MTKPPFPYFLCSAFRAAQRTSETPHEVAKRPQERPREVKKGSRSCPDALGGVLRPSLFDPAASNLLLRASLFDPAASNLPLRASFEPRNSNSHDLCRVKTMVSFQRNHDFTVFRVLRSEMLNAPQKRPWRAPKRPQERPREVQQSSRNCPDALRRRSGAAQRPRRSTRSCPDGPKSAPEISQRAPKRSQKLQRARPPRAVPETLCMAKSSAKRRVHRTVLWAKLPKDAVREHMRKHNRRNQSKPLGAKPVAANHQG